MSDIRLVSRLPASLLASFDAALTHFTALGYRCEEADRMNYKLVMDRGSNWGSLFGGKLSRRRIWMTARFKELGPSETEVQWSFDGWGKAANDEARAGFSAEVQALEAQVVAEAGRAASRPAASAGAPVVREVIIKEIVRLPCKYCGVLVDNTATRCPECGGPLG